MQAIPHGFPLMAPLPQAAAPLDTSLFHQYEMEETALFVPIESIKTLDFELLAKQGLASESQLDNIYSMRDYYKNIPQLNKCGPDGVTKLNSSGVILTLDLLVGYFDEVMEPNGEKRDVLHVVLRWSDGKPHEGDAPGWVLPGKRDQAYDPHHPDISIREANYSLIEKEIGVDRTAVAHHAVLAYFDDRIREPRFKSSGFLSFVLLHSKPSLKLGECIGVPLNGLKLLAERRIDLPLVPGSEVRSKMARNHDSILLAALKTAKFFHTMEKIKINQARFRELLRSDPYAKRPPVSTIEPGQECPVCEELLVGVHVVCTNGHSICGICLPIIRRNHQPCPICRGPLNPVPNLLVDRIIQYYNPAEYQRRYRQMNAGALPPSWEEDPAFQGRFVTYRA